MLNRRSERGLNLRKFEVGHFGSWRLAAGLTIFLIVTKATGASDSTFECCPGSDVNFDTEVCTDGSYFRIDCDEDGAYILEESYSVREKFHIDNQSQTLIEIGNGNKTLPKHRFCVSGKNSTRDFVVTCLDHYVRLPRWKNTLMAVLTIISGIFLVLILMVYFMLPELRSIQDKSIMCMVIFQALFYFVLSIELILIEEGFKIGPYVIVSRWLFLCYFFWMNLVSFNIWRSVWFKNFAINDKNLFRIFCAIVFVGPGLIIILSLVSDHTDGNHVLSGPTAMWVYFYSPVGVLLMLNVVYLSLTVWRLWIDNRSHTGGQLRSFRTNCLLYIKLVIVMGLLWIFEIASTFDFIPGSRLWPWIITDCLNGLQGVIMFVLLVATSRRVKTLLARKRPCGLSFPKSWADHDENEEEDISGTRVDKEFSVAS